MDMLKMNDVTSSRSKQLQIRCYLKTLDTMQIKRKFSSVLFLLCTLILSACSNLAVNNTNSSNIDLSKNPSDSEHKIINTYADKLISSYNVTFKNDILADNDKSMSLWEHAVSEMTFKPPKHTVNLKAVDYIKKHKKLLTQQLSYVIDGMPINTSADFSIFYFVMIRRYARSTLVLYTTLFRFRIL